MNDTCIEANKEEKRSVEKKKERGKGYDMILMLSW